MVLMVIGPAADLASSPSYGLLFEIRCIGRVLLVLGSRFKNEVNMHVSLCFSSVFSFTACCLLQRKCKWSPSL